MLNVNKYFSMNLVLQLLLCFVGVHSDWLCSELEQRLVNSLEEKCGKVWQRCHTNMEVQRMRKFHVEAFVRQYGGEESLDKCDLFQDYRY